MMELTYQQLSNARFRSAMNKLANSPLSTKTAYHVSKIYSKVQWWQKEIGRQYEADILGAFAKKDASGNIQPDPANPADFLMQEGTKKEDLVKTQASFADRKIQIDMDKLNLNHFQELKVTPEDLLALEPIYTVDDSPTGNVIPFPVKPS